MTTLDEMLNIYVTVHDKATKPLKTIENSFKEIHIVQKKVNSNAFRFLGLGLGLLFQGMVLKRIFGDFLRSIWKSYVDIIDVHDIFFQKTQQLSAAWAFFKFSLVDALSQSGLIQVLVDAIIDIANWLGKLSPEAKAGLGTLAIMGFFASVAMGALGQGLLFAIGMAAALELPLSALLAPLLLVAIYAGVAAAVFLFLNNKAMSPLEKTLTIIGVALTIIGVKMMVANVAFGFTVFLVGSLIIILALLSMKFGGLGNAIKAMAATAIMVLGFLGQFVVDGLITPLQYLAVMLIRIIQYMNRIAGTSFSTEGLENFVEWRPDIVGAAATFANKIQPDVVNEKPLQSIFTDMGNQMAQGFASVADQIGKSVGASVSDALERANALVIPSTSG